MAWSQDDIKKMLASPTEFRNRLIIDSGVPPSEGGSVSARGRKSFLGDVVEPWQKKDFAAIDPALTFLAGYTHVMPPIRRAWWQRCRGHSKTSDIASCLLYLLFSSRHKLAGIVAAGDKEQAGLVWQAMTRLLADNPWLADAMTFKRHSIEAKASGSVIDIIASDAATSWGFTPHLVVCDEVTHWTNQEFWNSIISSTIKKPECVILVGCNAGVGRDWKFQAMDYARSSPHWYFSAPQGVVASWINPHYLEEQRGLLPASEYARLWGNVWQESGGQYITREEALACIDPNLKEQAFGQPGWQYVAAIDYAPKHDYTVGLVSHFFEGRIIVDRMDTIVPRPDVPTRTEWVKNWMMRTWRNFGPNVRFIIDPYSLQTVREDLCKLGYEIEEFEFLSGAGNYELTVALRHAIYEQKIRWYPECGMVSTLSGRKTDLVDELSTVILTHPQGGLRCRIDHIQDSEHHDDRVFTLGVAVVHHLRARNFYGPERNPEEQDEPALAMFL